MARKKYIFPCFALVTVVQVGILEGQEVNCGDARYRKKQQLSFWEPLLKTEVIFAFVRKLLVYFCMAAVSTDAMPFGGNSSRWKNCHGQKLLLMLHSLTIAFWYEVILQNFPDIEEDSHSTSRPHFLKFLWTKWFHWFTANAYIDLFLSPRPFFDANFWVSSSDFDVLSMSCISGAVQK